MSIFFRKPIGVTSYNESITYMNLASLKDIYKEALKETNSILHTLDGDSENEELAEAMKLAGEELKKIKIVSDGVLLELDKNAEWDALTIALYGETNAGKSTIIETLRILMGEKTKKEQQRNFIQLCEKFNIDENIVDRLKLKNQEIERLEANLNIIKSQFSEMQEVRKNRENEMASYAGQLDLQVKALPLWRRFLSFFWQIQEEVDLKSINEELSHFIAETNRLLQKYEQEKSEIISKVDLTKKEISEIDGVMKDLEIYQDGEIIGDGRSDFTRESTSYEFTANGNKFVLLDVPGIEGKEELVREPIMQAMGKAHVVLYVTRKADPPQKGDEISGQKGTLEKIKEHLGAQTEVWTVFNKSIKSAEQLRVLKLVNEGESNSLKVLEDEMRKQLGQHYAGNLIVSAYPAFIASTNHFLPGNPKSKDRSKFLCVMDAPAIQEKTGIQLLAEKISSDMAENAKEKIRKSNFNKANNAVLQLKENISIENRSRFKPLFNKLEDQARNSTLQLESAACSLKKNIESSVMSLVKKKRDGARKNIYEKIESDISNDDFKGYLENFIRVGIEEIEYDFPKTIKSKFKSFQEEVKDIVDQFQEHAQEFLEDASMSSDIDLSLGIKIDNGVNVAGVIGTVIGAAALIFTSAGWALAVGAVGLVVSLGKAIWAFFDSDYKKAQQRKAADENIDDTFRNIESSYVSQLVEKMQKLEDKLIPIKNKFQLPAQQAEQITLALKKSVGQLDLVSKKIMKEGGI